MFQEKKWYSVSFNHKQANCFVWKINKEQVALLVPTFFRANLARSSIISFMRANLLTNNLPNCLQQQFDYLFVANEYELIHTEITDPHIIYEI